jgi:hypothetical protein
MSKVEELEREIEQLLPEDFAKLANWIACHPKQSSRDSMHEPMALRDHQAFLSGYAPEDEGLYDNAQDG